MRRGARFVLRWRGEGVAEIAELVGGAEVKVADRTAAEKLTNMRLYRRSGAVAGAGEDEFYLADLIGLSAFDADGARLGRSRAVHDYGAGASLEIAREETSRCWCRSRDACVPEVDVRRPRRGRATVTRGLAREVQRQVEAQ